MPDKHLFDGSLVGLSLLEADERSVEDFSSRAWRAFLSLKRLLPHSVAIVAGTVSLAAPLHGALLEIDPFLLLPSPERSTEDRLSPELRLVAQSGGILLGFSARGRMVVECSAPCSQSRMAELFGSAWSWPSQGAPADLLPPGLILLPTGPAATIQPSPDLEGKKLAFGGAILVQPKQVHSGISPQTLNHLASDPSIVFVEANYPVEIVRFQSDENAAPRLKCSTPSSDPYLGKQWNLERIRAIESWPNESGPAVIVAVVDDGVDDAHEDLRDAMWQRDPGHSERSAVRCNETPTGCDFFGGSSTPRTLRGIHGTQVAGIIAATRSNGVGIAGVTSRAKIMDLRICNSQSDPKSVSRCLQTDVVGAAFKYALDQGARVINASFTQVTRSEFLARIIAEAERRGAIIVAASGNDLPRDLDLSPLYPISYSHEFGNVIGVMSSNDFDRHSLGAHGRNTVFLGAPGQDIWTLTTGDRYLRSHGTSLAAAHVSGAVAAICSAAGPTGCRPDLVKATLQERARRPAPPLECITGGILQMTFAQNAASMERGTPQQGSEQRDPSSGRRNHIR